jgi:hypothetical protein
MTEKFLSLQYLSVQLTDDLSGTAVECPPEDPSCLGRQMAPPSAFADGAATATAQLPDDSSDVKPVPPDFAVQYSLSQPEADPAAPPSAASSSVATDCNGRVRAPDGSIVCPDAVAVLSPDDDITVEAHYDVTSPPPLAATSPVGGGDDADLLMESPSETSSIAAVVAKESIDDESIGQSIEAVSIVTAPVENEYYKYVDEEPSDAGEVKDVPEATWKATKMTASRIIFSKAETTTYRAVTTETTTTMTAKTRTLMLTGLKTAMTGQMNADDRNRIWKVQGIDDSTVTDDNDDVWKRSTTTNYSNNTISINAIAFHFCLAWKIMFNQRAGPGRAGPYVIRPGTARGFRSNPNNRYF